MSKHVDIIVVGGGLNGPTLALAAAQKGFDVAMVDATDPSTARSRSFDGRAYALSQSSHQLLKNIGVWDSVSKEAQPMLDIKVTDGRAGEGPSPWMMHFDHSEIGDDPLGFLVEDRHLRTAFQKAVNKNTQISVHAPQTVVEQTTSGGVCAITLADNTTISGRVIVGCDGRNSGTAQRAGIKRTAWDYDQIGIVCAVVHEKPHNGIAHQFFMPGGPLAILPLTENRCSIVWSEQKAAAERLIAVSDTDFIDALKPAFGDFLGEIKLCGDRFHYPLGLSMANDLIANRIALVGDAAHGIHPIAGQGLNAGFRDVAALVDVFLDARRKGEDIGGQQVLARYQSWRQFDTTKLALATDGFNHLFSNDNPLLRSIRDIGMGFINGTPALRRSFMREAAGLNGDVPSLMTR